VDGGGAGTTAGVADGIRCTLMRGGTSKGLYFVADDLPADPDDRDDLLLRLMGSPDPRQIDGLGGAHPLTSKVAVVRRSSEPDVDVEYHFLQVVVDEARVTDRQNCGNLLAGVAPFALERGLVAAADLARSSGAGPEPGDAGSGVDAHVVVRIRLRNTGGAARALVPLRDGRPRYDGDTAISGVPGTAAAIRLDFEDVAGSSCGALLPTGNPADEVAGIEASLVDNGMPVVVVRAADLGVSGYETPRELEADRALRHRLEEIRLAAGERMNLGDVGALTVPKVTLVAPPRDGGALATRTFIPHRCHDAIGVLGAVSVATATLLEDGPAAAVAAGADRSVDGTGEGGGSGADRADGDSGADHVVVLEHPTGHFEAAVELVPGAGGGAPEVRRAGIIRTARKLMDGVAFPRLRQEA
jgi:4-oxalomesaconate tautomerase